MGKFLIYQKKVTLRSYKTRSMSILFRLFLPLYPSITFYKFTSAAFKCWGKDSFTLWLGAIMICIISKQNMLFIVISCSFVLPYRHVSGKSTCCSKSQSATSSETQNCMFNKPRSFWLTIKEGPQTIHICFDQEKVPKKGLNVLVILFWVSE